MIQRRVRAAIATLLVVPMLLAACSDDATAPNGGAHTKYALVEVNGQALPVVVAEYENDEPGSCAGGLI